MTTKRAKGLVRYWKTCEKWLTKRNGFSHYKFSSVCKKSNCKRKWVRRDFKKSTLNILFWYHHSVSFCIENLSSIKLLRCQQLYWDFRQICPSSTFTTATSSYISTPSPAARQWSQQPHNKLDIVTWCQNSWKQRNENNTIIKQQVLSEYLLPVRWSPQLM